MGCVYSKNCFENRNQSHDSTKSKKTGEYGTTTVERSEVSTSFDSRVEDGNQNNHFSPGRNSNGVHRLHRISSQFLSPDSSQVVKVPQVKCELRYSFLSQRGFYPDALNKANQDCFCIHTPFGANLNDHFFGVFDGHGEFGTECSQFVKKKLCENLLRNRQFHTNPTEACSAAFLMTNSQLHLENIDDSMSGTTAITILVRGKTIVVANTGDSRAVIAEKRGDELVAVDLSNDQTPYRADELERVKLCGARVLTLDQIEGIKNPEIQQWGEDGDNGDPPRVWVKNGMYPGTAFTRSFGDSIAESIGVVASPEIVVLDLTSNHPFFVIASDGVFEFLSSQTVVDMVARFKDPHDACAAIVAESYRLWLQYETRTDDITIIVVHINGLTNTDNVEAEAGSPFHLPPLSQDSDVSVSGSETPSNIAWKSKNNRVRTDLSKTRLRAIESSLENGQSWIPPPSHRKTWEEEAHIERALHDHFLFRRLTDSQSQVLLDCMQRVEVKSGDVVVQQGGEGDCFYVVGNGDFEVVATQTEENGQEVTKILHQYTADKLSCFGELALMHNKPLQASVHAVTNGTLWALKREDFRGILTSEFSNLSSLKLLRSVDLLSRLTILQLSRISDSLMEVSFSDGEIIIDKNECLSALHIIQKGQVRLRYNANIMSPNAHSLQPNTPERAINSQKNNENEIDYPEGSHFGEWTLLGEQFDSLRAVALGDVICAVITKEKFDLAVGTLPKLQLDDKSEDTPLSKEDLTDTCAKKFEETKFSDLDWKTCLFSNDCCEIGLIQLKGSGNMLTLKRYSKKRINELGKESQVFKEKELMKSLSGSSGVPQVLSTFSDKSYFGILLNSYIACSLSSVLHTPLEELSVRFCAASLVIALKELHQKFILYRGVSADNLVFDRSGYLQLIDFRYGKKLMGERTFTICGTADYLAPEIIQGQGHGFAIDWWALGVLIYFMLQAETPFGSWRESELETVARIRKGQFTLPHTFSTDVVDLITKLLEVNEEERLGSQGIDSIQNHPWFNGIDWQGIIDRTASIPQEINSRISSYLENHIEEFCFPLSPPSQDKNQHDSPEWFEDW